MQNAVKDRLRIPELEGFYAPGYIYGNAKIHKHA